MGKGFTYILCTNKIGKCPQAKSIRRRKQFSASIGALQYFIMYILKNSSNCIIISFVQTDLNEGP